MEIFNKTIIVGEQTLKSHNKDKNIDIDIDKQSSWWYKSKNNKKRVLLCGTYPIGTTNGYSKVVYYICKHIAKYEDIELTVYGFQNVNNSNGANIRNDLSENIKLYDVMAHEKPIRNGFGEKEIGDYIKKNPQDIIIIFNDSIVTTALTQTLVKECWDEKKNFKLISYMDQVYQYQKKEYIQILNVFFDGIIAFTPYWKEVALKLGITKPIYMFPHGFDHNLYYPIPQNIARLYNNYDEKDFMVLNLNRNQPRKRWDITMVAWANFIVKYYNNNDFKRDIKLVIATNHETYWDLFDILENEIKFTNVPWEFAKKTLVTIDNPQKLSDREINILYNSCDIGLNTADGEGFGLCTFEGLALGKPQVASYIGGMREFINEDYSFIIKPTSYLYLDTKTAGIGGKAELVSPEDCADVFWKYFTDSKLLEEHGKKARKHILQNYRWESLVEYFYKNILKKL